MRDVYKDHFTTQIIISHCNLIHLHTQHCTRHIKHIGGHTEGSNRIHIIEIVLVTYDRLLSLPNIIDESRDVFLRNVRQLQRSYSEFNNHRIIIITCRPIVARKVWPKVAMHYIRSALYFHYDITLYVQVLSSSDRF